MKTFLLNGDEGQLIGFEISNSFLSSSGIAKYIRRIKGCEVVGTRRWFSADEVHVHFLFSGKRFIVWEPFGDNSRLWVGPEDGEVTPPEIIYELKANFEGTSRVSISR
ncbi:hypothetical protein [Marinimicrobium sp. LS-A18]|uniref:hypothetical protein n=1 Tax=Marinimicrobium sp. LS-A18 TaxID=1381596 RepID=UPI001269648A|nr:hypothetical protein [Marinimicrobium sp. LS-A18]